MKIKLLMLIVVTASLLFGGDILRINKMDGSIQNVQISEIEKLTFVDLEQGDFLRVNKYDETSNYSDLTTVDQLRFSDWYGFLLAPQNLAILADSSSVNLNWDLVTGATDYLIYRSETDPYTGFAKIDSTTNVTFQDNGVLTGNKYFYLIKARNSQ